MCASDCIDQDIECTALCPCYEKCPNGCPCDYILGIEILIVKFSTKFDPKFRSEWCPLDPCYGDSDQFLDFCVEDMKALFVKCTGDCKPFDIKCQTICTEVHIENIEKCSCTGG